MLEKTIKLKTCKVCKTKFKPYTSLSKACSPKCALKLVEDQKAKANSKAAKEYRKENMTKGELTKLAQVELNKYIRLRDHDKPCISCGCTDTGKDGRGGRWDAGHYRSIGSAPELRFDEDNCHKQCKKCNQFLSGNVVNYRIGLLSRIGPERLARLEGPHEPTKYSPQDLREIASKYRSLAKEVQSTLNQRDVSA